MMTANVNRRFSHSPLRRGCAFAALAVCAVVASPQSADACPTHYEEVTSWQYQPTRYTNAAAGDVAITSATDPIIEGISSVLGMSYGHSAVVYDNTGYRFSESTANGGTPPSSQATGEPHVCSRPISPYYLQRMSPGVKNATQRTPRSGVLVKNIAQSYCTGANDTYHINSIKNRKRSGSCAAFAEDECSVPVTGSWQRVFNGTEHYNAAMFIYNAAYGMCGGVINGSWPWQGIGCGGVPATGACNGTACSACDRAAAQVVNEFAKTASGSQDGWTDRNVFGQLLGEAKTNFQPGGWWSNNGGNWTPRTPDNIVAAGQATGKAIWGTNIASGGYQSVTTCEPITYYIGGIRNWLTGATSTATRNSYIEIYGRFSSSQGSVTIGNYTCSVTYWSQDQVNCRVHGSTPLNWQTLKLSSNGWLYGSVKVES